MTVVSLLSELTLPAVYCPKVVASLNLDSSPRRVSLWQLQDRFGGLTHRMGAKLTGNRVGPDFTVKMIPSAMNSLTWLVSDEPFVTGEGIWWGLCRMMRSTQFSLLAVRFTGWLSC